MIGFITTGNYSYLRGYGFGMGWIQGEKAVEIGKELWKQGERKNLYVLYSNINSREYKLGLIEKVSD